jgi:hypothetical protein
MRREGAKQDAKKMKNPVGFPIFLNSFASCLALSRLRGECSGRRVIAQGYLD